MDEIRHVGKSALCFQRGYRLPGQIASLRSPRTPNGSRSTSPPVLWHVSVLLVTHGVLIPGQNPCGILQLQLLLMVRAKTRERHQPDL
jgi:hypothetical protein